MPIAFGAEDVAAPAQSVAPNHPLTFGADDVDTSASKQITFGADDVASKQAIALGPEDVLRASLSAPSGPTEIGPAPSPSIWQRISNIFSTGIPALDASGRFEAASHTDSGTLASGETPRMQIATPEAALTESEQRKHPVLTGIGEFGGGLTSPQSFATIASTGGLGELGGAAGQIIPRLMSAGFGAQQIYSAAKSVPEIRSALQRGDYPEVERLLTLATLQTGAALLGLKHAATGKGAITGEKGPSLAEKAESETKPQPLAQTKTVEPTSPVGEILKQPGAPEVRIVDSAATKQHLENQGTVVQPTKVFHGTTSELSDISQLKPEEYSRIGAAGIGAYVSESGEQAGHYTGPAEAGTGGRVLGGELASDANLLNGNEPLPRAIWDELELPGKPKSYMDVVKALHEQSPDDDSGLREFQKAVAEDYDGVKYQHRYASGLRSGIMLFGEDIAGRPLSDVLKPTVPTMARVVSDDYVPVVSQNEVLAEAVARMVKNSGELQKLGIDPSRIQSREDVAKILDDASAHIAKNLDPRVGSVISFDATKQLAAQLNMTPEELLSRKSGTAFSAGQAVAARALLESSTDDAINLARSAVGGDGTARESLAKALAQTQEIQSQVKGVAAEAGRALSSFRIEDLPKLKIANALSQLPPESLTKAAELLAKIDPNDTRQANEFISKITPSTTPQKVFEAYRNALLSSPKTLVVKMASETTMMVLEGMTKAVRGGISKLTGQQDAFASESWFYAKGAMQALQHAKAVLSGEFDLQDAPGFEDSGTRAIKGVLGSIARTPQTILSRQTNLMYALNYFGQINAEAARAAINEGLSGQELHARQEFLAHNPTDAMRDSANSLALHNTFQNEVGKFGAGMRRGIKDDPTGITKYVLPFFLVPVNLVKATGEYSPYGLIKSFMGGKEILGTGEAMSQRARADLAVRGLIGSSLAAGIAHLALQNSITGGGPVNFRQKETLESTGWQAYSLKIGGKYYSYHRLEPLGMAFALVADAIHGIHSGDPETIAASKTDLAIAHLMRNAGSFPFLMSLSNAVEAIQDPTGNKISKFIARQVAGFVPAIVSNVAQMADRTVRHPSGDTLPETIKQTLESRIPGLTHRVAPVLDLTGKLVQRPLSQLGGANPFPVSSAKNDPAITELSRLGIATPQPPKSVRLRGQAVALAPHESALIASEEGRELSGRLAKIMQQPGWQKRTDAQKRKAIQELREKITAQRSRRVSEMRDERVSALDRLGSKDVSGRSL